jgi:hypothetical protein
MRYTKRMKKIKREKRSRFSVVYKSDRKRHFKSSKNMSYKPLPCSSLPVIFKNRELGFKNCLTDGTTWCNQHHRFQTAIRSYVRTRNDEFGKTQVYVGLGLCFTIISHVEQMVPPEKEKNKEEDVDTRPRYNLEYFNYYNCSEDEEEENVSTDIR